MTNYPRPEGKMPRSDQPCPLCGVPARVAHKPTCPWQLWADAEKRAGVE